SRQVIAAPGETAADYTPRLAASPGLAHRTQRLSGKGAGGGILSEYSVRVKEYSAGSSASPAMGCAGCHSILSSFHQHTPHPPPPPSRTDSHSGVRGWPRPGTDRAHLPGDCWETAGRGGGGQ